MSEPKEFSEFASECMALIARMNDESLSQEVRDDAQREVRRIMREEIDARIMRGVAHGTAARAGREIK